MSHVMQVNPRNEDLMVLDRAGRRITHKEGGTRVQCSPHISRLIKAGDLVEVTKKTVQPRAKGSLGNPTNTQGE